METDRYVEALELPLATLTGEKVSLGELLAQPLVVFMWASW